MKDIRKKDEPDVSGGATLGDILDPTSPLVPIIGPTCPDPGQEDKDYPPAPGPIA